jgi:hypothetical protein
MRSPAGSGALTNEDAAEAKRVVLEEARRAVAEVARGAARALVLTGSLARDEGTVRRQAEGLIMLGDAEFLLVLDRGARLSSDVDMALSHAVEAAAFGRGVQCAVDIAVVHDDFLRTLPPHIFTYELRACGQVIWGDHSILSLIPPPRAGGIDREDAWRLLANRLVEHLAVRDDAEPAAALPWRTEYRVVKLFLDMATSLLVFTGDYAPTYRQRAERLRDLAARGSGGLPFPLLDFARRVEECTRWKVGTDHHRWRPDNLAEEARSYARELWRWELQHLTGLDGVADERTLMATWMRAQPYRVRLRGWLFAVRRCGWLKGWRRWPHFARLAARSSPRYLIYAAAADLAFARPEGAANGRDGQRDPAALTQYLPLTDPGRGRDPGALARAIARNYRELVVGTRA